MAASPTSPQRAGDARQSIGVGLLVIAALLALRQLGVWSSDALVWPIALTAGGLTLLWRRSASGSASPRASLATLRSALPETTLNARTAAGAALVFGGGIAFLAAADALAEARSVLLAAIVVLVGVALIFGPAWLRIARSLTEERAQRARSEERAEVAAHLHDSVLQTLALIQRRAGDAREVAALARRQERELRSWLAGDERPPEASLAAALQAVANEVEDTHGVVVEVVAVGDCPVDERVSATVQAAREAMLNAARFAGTGRVDVFAEAAGGRVEVFVRDRGAGFDPAAIPADRRGVRESIFGRMARCGGRAEVRSAPGEGTEVELVLEDAPS
ncbi:MAG TPA: ATP-binding protein [Capillimicrobium sp.]